MGFGVMILWWSLEEEFKDAVDGMRSGISEVKYKWGGAS